ncbi:MAG: TolC family protein [Rhodobacterales bacterium]|nr:TolC family protein [Rhodobacterales bacterium]
MGSRFKGAGLFAAAFGLAVFGAGQASAATLGDLVQQVLAGDNRIKAAEADLSSAREKAREALGDWYPTLNVDGSYGYEHQNQPRPLRDSSKVPRELDLRITQLLWDFGKTNAGVRKARLAMEESVANLDSQRQLVLFEAATAYLNLSKARDVVGFARQSEGNIKKQTELEDALVKRGAGFSTDVLQAKTQLAGAQARLVRAEGQLAVARNAFQRVFGDVVPPDEELVAPNLPVDLLPANVEEAVRRALDSNPQLRVSGLQTRQAAEDLTRNKADKFLPRIQAVGSLKFKKDINALPGYEREALAKVEFSYPFNLGLTAFNSDRSFRDQLTASALRTADSRDEVERQARNAWQALVTARENHRLLTNQSNIAAEFLEQARKERQLGRRSLLDVLSGETSLINASSDAAAAKANVAVAVYTLLTVMGELDDKAFAK